MSTLMLAPRGSFSDSCDLAAGTSSRGTQSHHRGVLHTCITCTISQLLPTDCISSCAAHTDVSCEPFNKLTCIKKYKKKIKKKFIP